VGLVGCLPHANVITLALAPVFSSCLHPDLLAPVTGSPVSDICRSCRLICQLSRRPKLRTLPPAIHPETQLPPHPNPRPASRILNPEPTAIRPGHPLRLGLLHFMLVELIVACQLPLPVRSPPPQSYNI